MGEKTRPQKFFDNAFACETVNSGEKGYMRLEDGFNLIQIRAKDGRNTAVYELLAYKEPGFDDGFSCDGFAEAGLVDTITHSLNVDIDYSLFSDPTTQFYSNFLADLIDVLTCNAQLYLGDASVTSASFTINSVTADRSGYTDISVTFSAPIGALTSSYRSQARENLQVFFSNCASVSVMNLQAYDWSTNSISISCEEGTVIIPLDPYNAFALPDIQVKEGSLGYATADTRESTAGRCQGGPERFGVILNRTSGTTGCGMWERPVGTILNKPISSTGFAEFYMGGSDTCSGEVGFDFATPIYKAIANPAASIETLMKNPSLYKSGPGATTVWYRLSDADGRSQVQLSGLTVSMTLNLNGATTKGECETPSSVTGAGVCRVEAVSEWFSTTNEQVGQATISYQYDSVTYGTSLTQQFTLKKHYEHDAVSEPTIILEAPKYPVFEGEESVVEVFVNTGDYGLYAGDFEILISDAGNGEQWDSTFEYVGFTSSGIWQAKASEAIPGYLISVVFLSPSTNVLEEETKGTKLKIGEITLRQKITSYTSSFGTYACVAGSSWFDCDQGLLSATVRQMANWGFDLRSNGNCERRKFVLSQCPFGWLRTRIGEFY